MRRWLLTHHVDGLPFFDPHEQIGRCRARFPWYLPDKEGIDKGPGMIMSSARLTDECHLVPYALIFSSTGKNVHRSAGRRTASIGLTTNKQPGIILVLCKQSLEACLIDPVCAVVGVLGTG